MTDTRATTKMKPITRTATMDAAMPIYQHYGVRLNLLQKCWQCKVADSTKRLRRNHLDTERQMDTLMNERMPGQIWEIMRKRGGKDSTGRLAY